MSAAARKKSALDRRLKELEKEAERVRADKRTLSRALKRPDEAIAWDKLKSIQSAGSRERPRAKAPASPPPPRAPEVEEEEIVDAHDLFSWKRRPRPVREKRVEESISGPPVEDEEPVPPARPKRKSKGRDNRFTMDEHFASYFASGSFATGGPARQGKTVQRNKAVFMIVVVLVVGFIIVKLVF